MSTGFAFVLGAIKKRRSPFVFKGNGQKGRTSSIHDQDKAPYYDIIKRQDILPKHMALFQQKKRLKGMLCSSQDGLGQFS